ncbi:hypothetical protein Ocin01_07214 [Orchesella cincta]|uniref:Uncharacterized protein n=1 Tax=Orchesella cincta TaxID=48709 RepID=A0A1D2N335_ORCCI|nr:hypothetical protein Ocin01_07214 [Orchesella cincta]
MANNGLKVLTAKIMDELSDRPPQNSPEFASQQPAAPQSRAGWEPSSICECSISSGARLFSLIDIPVIFGFILIQARFINDSIDNANGVNNTSGTYVPLPPGPVTYAIIITELVAIFVRLIGCIFLLCGVFKNKRCLCILWIVCALGHVLAEFSFNLYESHYSQRNVLSTLSSVTIYIVFGIWIVAAFMQWLNTEAAPRDAADRANARARARARNPIYRMTMLSHGMYCCIVCNGLNWT